MFGMSFSKTGIRVPQILAFIAFVSVGNKNDPWFSFLAAWDVAKYTIDVAVQPECVFVEFIGSDAGAGFQWE